MKVAVVGRGNVGNGLADLWERAGHEVARIGREGGDVSDAEAVLVAVPGGPTAKSFNTNFAALYNEIREAHSAPSNLWSGDEEARQVVEQLNRDAGYEPVYAGSLENAAVQETFIKITAGIRRGGMGPFLYRMAPPDRL